MPVPYLSFSKCSVIDTLAKSNKLPFVFEVPNPSTLTEYGKDLFPAFLSFAYEPVY